MRYTACSNLKSQKSKMGGQGSEVRMLYYYYARDNPVYAKVLCSQLFLHSIIHMWRFFATHCSFHVVVRVQETLLLRISALVALATRPSQGEPPCCDPLVLEMESAVISRPARQSCYRKARPAVWLALQTRWPRPREASTSDISRVAWPCSKTGGQFVSGELLLPTD